MDKKAETMALKAEAQRTGFELVGVCQAQEPPRIGQFKQWLDAGYAGQMHYLRNRAEAYEHPRHVLEGVKSLVMLGMNYRTSEPASISDGQGRVSRYAWGTEDYHDVIHEKLKHLCEYVRQQFPDASVRGVVDTAPLLERDFAQLAGLGWIGKNTLLLNKEHGSWFFLAALLTNVELDYDAPFEADHCGTCRACLDACPTNAFPQPYVLDATKCISYLTIELRDSIPNDLRNGIGDWVFGCDVCQDVCPWNHRIPTTPNEHFEPQPSMNSLDAIELLEMDDEAFKERFRRTPLWRTKRRGLLRNAAIALGNSKSSKAIDALKRGVQDKEPLVRSACEWALAKIKNESCQA